MQPLDHADYWSGSEDAIRRSTWDWILSVRGNRLASTPPSVGAERGFDPGLGGRTRLSIECGCDSFVVESERLQLTVDNLPCPPLGLFSGKEGHLDVGRPRFHHPGGATGTGLAREFAGRLVFAAAPGGVRG